VYTFDNYTNQPALQASCNIPAVIKPVVLVEKVINQQKTVISNQVDKLQVTYPEAATALAALKKENPQAQVDSIIVTPESNSSSVTFVSPSPNGKEYFINTYLFSG